MGSLPWHYDGDANLREGGMFWRETGDPERVWFVRIRPLRDAGGPDNLFRLTTGHVETPDDPERLAAALAPHGLAPGDARREDVVRAFAGHRAPDDDEDVVIRIGPPDGLHRGRGDDPEPDFVLRAGTSLRKWVTREYLLAEPAPVAGPRP